MPAFPLPLTLVRNGPKPLYRQVYEQLRAAILSGRLPPGTRLPSRSRSMLSCFHVEHNFSLMVSGFQSLMSLFRLFKRKDLIKVNGELTLLDELRQFGQLSPIGAEVEDVRVNVTRRDHLLKIHNRDKPPPLAHHLQTSCCCLSPNTIQDGINAFGMGRVDNVSKVGPRIINEFGGSELPKVRMMLPLCSDYDMCSNTRSQLDGKRAGSSSSTSNQERFSFLDLQQVVDCLVSGQPIDGESSCVQGIKRGWNRSHEICRDSHRVGIMTNAHLIRRAEYRHSRVQSCDQSSNLFNDPC